MARQRKVVPPVEPVAPPAGPVAKVKCPQCDRVFKSALAVRIHEGFAHKAGAQVKVKPMRKRHGRGLTVKATADGMLRIAVVPALVGPVVAMLKAAGAGPIIVE